MVRPLGGSSGLVEWVLDGRRPASEPDSFAGCWTGDIKGRGASLPDGSSLVESLSGGSAGIAMNGFLGCLEEGWRGTESIAGGLADIPDSSISRQATVRR